MGSGPPARAATPLAWPLFTRVALAALLVAGGHTGTAPWYAGPRLGSGRAPCVAPLLLLPRVQQEQQDQDLFHLSCTCPLTPPCTIAGSLQHGRWRGRAHRAAGRVFPAPHSGASCRRLGRLLPPVQLKKQHNLGLKRGRGQGMRAGSPSSPGGGVCVECALSPPCHSGPGEVHPSLLRAKDPHSAFLGDSGPPSRASTHLTEG